MSSFNDLPRFKQAFPSATCLDDDGVDALVHGILLQAYMDSEQCFDEITNFALSDWFNTLTSISPELFLLKCLECRCGENKPHLYRGLRKWPRYQQPKPVLYFSRYSEVIRDLVDKDDDRVHQVVTARRMVCDAFKAKRGVKWRLVKEE